MKTSEFKKKVEGLRYEVIEIEDVIKVRTYFGKDCARLCAANKLFMLNTENSELAKLCIEYVETPISEHVDEKKYTVIVPDPEKRGKHVLALGRLVERKGEIIIMRVKKETLESDRCHLTESEIKKNHAYLWQFAKEI